MSPTATAAPNKPKPADTDPREHLRQLTDEELLARMNEHVRTSVASIREAAYCFEILEERGHDFAGMRYAHILRRIARGQLDPELLWEFIDSPNRPLVERLPIDQQRKLAADPMVEVIEPKPGGGFTKRKVDLKKAPANVARLVVGPDGLRSAEEQESHLSMQKAAAAVSKAETVDDKLPEFRTKTVQVRMTIEDHDNLSRHAIDAGLTVPDMAYRFLVRSGAFKRPKT